MIKAPSHKIYMYKTPSEIGNGKEMRQFIYHSNRIMENGFGIHKLRFH